MGVRALRPGSSQNASSTPAPPPAKARSRLCQKLLEDASPSCAKRPPDGDLGLARHSSGEQPARDVGAADQQQELDCDAEHEEKPFRSSVQIGEVLPPQWDQAEGPAAADLRELLLQPARELLQLGRARLVDTWTSASLNGSRTRDGQPAALGRMREPCCPSIAPDRVKSSNLASTSGGLRLTG
jgi:hypothetical protein